MKSLQNLFNLFFFFFTKLWKAFIFRCVFILYVRLITKLVLSLNKKLRLINMTKCHSIQPVIFITIYVC